MKSLLSFGKQTFSCYGKAQGGSFAAAIAYYTLFSIFPIAVFLIGFSGYFLSDAQRNSMVNQLTSALGGGSTSNVREQVMAVTSGRAGLGIIGLIGAIWSGSAVFTAIRTGLNAVWEKQKKASWLVQKIKDLGGVIGLGVLLALSIASTAVLTVVANLSKKLLGEEVGHVVAYPIGLLLIVAPIGIVFLAFGALYVWASPPHIHWRQVWPGALFGAIGFVALSFGFSLYARYFGHYDKVYGTLGAVIAFLFYAYLIGVLILLGAELVEQYALLRATGHVVTDACDTPDEQQKHGGQLRPAVGRSVNGHGAREIPLFVLAKDARTPKGSKQQTITAAEAFPEDAASFETITPAALGSSS